MKDLKLLTVFIFTLTLIYHFIMVRTEHPYLGLIMVIPLLTFTIQHIASRKKIKVQQFSLKKSKIAPLFLSILLPILLGLIVHTYLFTTNVGSFLFIERNQLFFFLGIGLTVAAFSAGLEEIIWRGYYQTKLRMSYSFHKTAIIIAFIWSIWHLPIAYFYKGYTNLLIGTVSYFIILFITSYVLSYLREWSGSVIPAALFHGLMNVFYFHDGIQIEMPLHMTELVKCVYLLLFFVASIIILRATNFIKT
ncbi:CPBP family intramembrane glutamic endopeptidase [Solibacillus sp. FSL K6-4121]|uniref:CPBP family intramembrane glutamic endopeptidase n=1 Tax=Solibacillus sp. FSL K6-4121 TaxID=2921505 RepID=UPI0030F52BCA